VIAVSPRWSDATWPELAARAGSDEVVLVPVGATEQHGPHLPTATDSIIATALCEEAAGRSGALVLPTITIGASYGHGTMLPGTLSLAPRQLADVACRYVEWSAVSGFRRVLFVNAHLGNVAALSIATDHLRLFRPDVRTGVVSWWDLDPGLGAELVADGNDVHANRAETALMLHIAPNQVRLQRLNDADDEDRTGGLVFRYTAPALSRNGVTGRPSEATTELGHKLFETAVSALADRIARGRSEEPPLGLAPAPTLTPTSEAWEA
jgi:creatinine amidohydrolase